MGRLEAVELFPAAWLHVRVAVDCKEHEAAAQPVRRGLDLGLSHVLICLWQ